MNKGRTYEEKASQFLSLKGYKILERNFFSSAGEIDIIAQDKRNLVFVEVKERKKTFYSPREAVERSKRRKIVQTAKYYLLKRRVKDTPLRFDVVSIVEGEGWRVYELIKNAFCVDE
ncbi:MAG: YraN family protein [Candidatus Omnitrophota bacterium]|nr:MAG: YraN family protein [Candidatus Omnitrophota bacterium]